MLNGVDTSNVMIAGIELMMEILSIKKLVFFLMNFPSALSVYLPNLGFLNGRVVTCMQIPSCGLKIALNLYKLCLWGTSSL